MDGNKDPERADALEQYKKKLLELREMEAKLKTLRLDIKGLQKDFDTTEDNIKALQSVGQIIGEVLKQLDEERCEHESPWSRYGREGGSTFADLRFQSLSKHPPGRDTSLVVDPKSTKPSSSKVPVSRST